MITLDQFKSTRATCSDLSKLPYSTEDLAGLSGWSYLDGLYIIDGPNGPWTMTDRDEITGTLAEIEATLYAWACREGYCGSKEEAV